MQRSNLTKRSRTLLAQRAMTGERITLRTTGKAGGEGEIYQVAEEPSLLAKIYHPDQRSPDRAAKLAAMLNDPPLDPLEPPITIAWPVDAVVVDGAIVGFLMPKAPETRPLHEVYTPKMRRRELPGLTYRYLVRMARNLAAAVDVLHERGYTIGDVNESNVLAAPTALVTLVDTDSFQVVDRQQRRTFRCPVGKPEYTPPELQGRNFREVDRTAAQDCFGLAVLLFQLLMEGTHPFDGAFLGSGDPPLIDQRIAAGEFPYSARSPRWKPKPIAPPFAGLDPQLQNLFRQAFETRHPADRPSARQWAAVLDSAENHLVTCSTNPQHVYFGHQGSCPWCDRARQFRGRDPFPSPAAIRRGEHIQLAKTHRKAPRVVTPPPTAASIQTIPLRPLPPTVTARNYWLAPGYSRSSAWVSAIGLGCCFLVSAAIIASREALDFSTPGVPALIPRVLTARPPVLSPEQQRLALIQFDSTRSQIEGLTNQLTQEMVTLMQDSDRPLVRLSRSALTERSQRAIASALGKPGLFYGNGTISGSLPPDGEATQTVLQIQWIEAISEYQRRILGDQYAWGYLDSATVRHLTADSRQILLDSLTPVPVAVPSTLTQPDRPANQP